MSNGNIEINLSPYLAVMERCLCDSKDNEISISERSDLLAEIRKLADVAQLDHLAPAEFYRQLGLHAVIYLSRRVGSELVADNLIKRLRSR